MAKKSIPDDRKIERTVAFVVMRLTSSRFAAKQLQTIGDRSLLNWILDRLSKSKQIDEIVIATAAEKANEPLRDLAGQNGVVCFWFEGQVDHVTTRLRRAAETFDADICVMVSGDCPLVYAPAIDQMVLELKNKPDADIVRILPDANDRSAAIEGIAVARRRAWQLADDLADRPELKEHQFPVIGMQPERFLAAEMKLPRELYMSPHRLSVDTVADLEFMNRIHDTLAKDGKDFKLPEVVRLLEGRPDLKTINAHVHQRRLVETIMRVLFVVDAGKAYGYGHLMRSLELALQIVESLGWPVNFVVDDEKALTLVTDHGLRAIRGAFARPASGNGNGSNPFELEKISHDYDLLVLDIFDQRGPQPGWRSRSGISMPTVVMENLQPWAYEADLIILPNLLNREAARAIDVSYDSNGRRQHRQSARIVGGPEYLIIRRSIRQAQNGHSKEIDLLVYLHDNALKKDIAASFHKQNIRIEILNDFNPDFANLLARSKIFLSGFGISFNEALALNTLPICWPDSESHRQDAVKFYRELDLPEYVVNSTAELVDVVLPILDSGICSCAAVEDGTRAIIDELTRLVKAA